MANLELAEPEEIVAGASGIIPSALKAHLRAGYFAQQGGAFRARLDARDAVENPRVLLSPLLDGNSTMYFMKGFISDVEPAFDSSSSPLMRFCSETSSLTSGVNR